MSWRQLLAKYKSRFQILDAILFIQGACALACVDCRDIQLQ